MPVPEFVAVGNATRDVVPGGWRLGGTVSFAAVQAQRLGCTSGVVTRAPADLDLAKNLPGIELAVTLSDVATTFENRYSSAGRDQHILAEGSAIEAGDVPEAWRSASMVLLGPVWGEIPPGFARVFHDSSLIGVSAQGWLRDADESHRVRHRSWIGEPFWDGCDVLFVSDEDLADGRSELDRWTADVAIVAKTESSRGARIFAGRRWWHMDAFPETEVDPTGAGDTFATGFLIRLHETGDAGDAARFGAAAASLSVRGIGIAAMPDRAEVEERMRRYPEIALR